MLYEVITERPQVRIEPRSRIEGNQSVQQIRVAFARHQVRNNFV